MAIDDVTYASATEIARAVAVKSPPRTGDFVFLAPTAVNSAALGIWAVFPNLQHFWLLDAVTRLPQFTRTAGNSPLCSIRYTVILLTRI